MRKFTRCMGLSLLMLSPQLWADNPWAGYRGVEKKPQRPMRPQAPHRPQWPRPQPQPNVSIQYQGPTTVVQNSQSYSFVNGQPSGSISSSRYVFISDWQRLGLPAPPVGMYWIYENGRYALVPNR
ncbi:RcnB family protein [uncultured Acinetobacter sp.]|uniref:RcnB family protein n=1 Tax=uncultured Acinetobacter sp. TaxID=165433 RepID=UPI00263963D1|nr:RcnB family protein [uncultured Acinetobacter sp.]